MICTVLVLQIRIGRQRLSVNAKFRAVPLLLCTLYLILSFSHVVDLVVFFRLFNVMHDTMPYLSVFGVQCGDLLCPKLNRVSFSLVYFNKTTTSYGKCS